MVKNLKCTIIYKVYSMAQQMVKMAKFTIDMINCTVHMGYLQALHKEDGCKSHNATN